MGSFSEGKHTGMFSKPMHKKMSETSEQSTWSYFQGSEELWTVFHKSRMSLIYIVKNKV